MHAPRSGAWIGVVGGLAVAGAILSALAVQAQQQPTFQTSVDLVVADVQVVDRDGRVIAGLTPDRFQVNIGGRQQKVVSAEYIDYSSSASAVPAPPVVSGAVTGSSASAAAPVNAAAAPARAAEGRLIIMAIDVMSFPPEVSVGVIKAAKAFVKQLSPNDLVGVFPYPSGPKVDPTTDHVAVAAGLDKVMGMRMPLAASRFRIRPAEYIDAAIDMREGTDNLPPASEALVVRECRGRSLPDPCPSALRTEVLSGVALAQAVAEQSIGGLRGLLEGLAAVPGRKTVVLLTAGMLTTDRPDGKPNIEGLSMMAGQEAARANASVYSIFVDARYLEQNSAEQRSSGFNQYINLMRDSDTMSRWYDRFSGTAGGMMITDLIGRGEIGFQRVLRETSGYYRLGVDVGTLERSGKPQQMRVRVDVRNATVRGRSWVILPPKN